MADVVALSRGGGKTTRALQWLAEDPERRVLISMTLGAERAVRALAAGLGYNSLTGLNFEIANHQRRRRVNAVYAVDNADIILARHLDLDGPVDLVTLTGGVV